MKQCRTRGEQQDTAEAVRMSVLQERLSSTQAEGPGCLIHVKRRIPTPSREIPLNPANASRLAAAGQPQTPLPSRAVRARQGYSDAVHTHTQGLSTTRLPPPTPPPGSPPATSSPCGRGKTCAQTPTVEKIAPPADTEESWSYGSTAKHVPMSPSLHASQGPCRHSSRGLTGLLCLSETLLP